LGNKRSVTIEEDKFWAGEDGAVGKDIEEQIRLYLERKRILSLLEKKYEGKKTGGRFDTDCVTILLLQTLNYLLLAALLSASACSINFKRV